MKQRETFASRLGFILVSAGCAIGLGNVWKFPYICGQYGGAAFIVIYLVFLAILGLPILVCEFTIGLSLIHISEPTRHLILSRRKGHAGTALSGAAWQVHIFL